MSALKPLTIVGGGLSGLTLGIALRRSEIPVTLIEAGDYPRHRVCGEFISGRGQAVLNRLNLTQSLARAEALLARTVAFFSSRAASPACDMPEPAISVSRYRLDAALASEFRGLGGELRVRERWRASDWPEGVVRAIGRRPQPLTGGWRWFGLKVHARNVPLTADLEMHLGSHGYVGMSWLCDGEVNICGLFWRPAAENSELPKDWLEILRGTPGSPRYQRLANAQFDEHSVCAVAGLSLRAGRASLHPECSVGDSITMIPPVTGNGMSMAFESAEIAAGPLTAYSRGEMDWTTARKQIAAACDQLFSRRLAWAGFMQQLLVRPAMQNLLVNIVPRQRWLWRLLVAKTR